MDGDVFSYSWRLTKSMWANIMMKEMQLPSALENVFLENDIDLPQLSMDEVRAVGMEIRMSNISNR